MLVSDDAAAQGVFRRRRAGGADASDGLSLRAALQHCAAAYYLVHSLASADFEAKDAAAAGAFGEAAAEEGGVERVVYLGGLGADDDATGAPPGSNRAIHMPHAAMTAPTDAQHPHRAKAG